MYGHNEQEYQELVGLYDTLTRRLGAIDTDIGRTTDSEARLVLQDRRSELAEERSQVAAQMAIMETRQPAQRTDGATVTTVAGYDPMQDGRVSNVESTLRTMDQKLDRMTDSLHDLDTRYRLLEVKVETLANTVNRLDATVQSMRGVNPEYSRIWLIAGGMAIIIMLLLLIFITWRLV